MNILLEAPILTQSGYGEHARLVFESIKDSGHVIFTNPLKWGQTSWNVEEANEEIKQSIIRFGAAMDEARSTNSQLSFDVQIHVGIPNEFEKKAPYSVCVTAGIETDKVSSNWIIKTHQGIDKLIVPSNHAKDGFINTSYELKDEQRGIATTADCNCPVSVVPYPVKKFDSNDKMNSLNLETDFNFLTVALWGPRKNLTNMIRWFLEEFKGDPNVGLVLKTGLSRSSVIDKNKTIKTIKSITKDYSDSKCKIYLLHGNLTEEEVHSLYHHPKIKAYATTTHGEGYGLPIFEAAYSGLPIIATDWSGHLDFLSGPIKQGNKLKVKKLFSRVSCKLREIDQSVWWDHILVEGSKWAHPDAHSFKTQIRKVYKDYGLYKKHARALKEYVEESHNKEHILSLMKNEILGELNNLNFQNQEEDSENGEMIVL